MRPALPPETFPRLRGQISKFASLRDLTISIGRKRWKQIQ